MRTHKTKFLNSSKFYRAVRKYKRESYGRENSSSQSAPPIIILHPPTPPNVPSFDLSPKLIVEPEYLEVLDNPSVQSNSDFNSTATTDTEVEYDFLEISGRELLRVWALKHQVPHLTVDGLLKILTQIGVKDLPKDSRTLLQTPRKVNIAEVSGGQYWHNGFGEIKTILLLNEMKCDSKISLTFNMDGLPISRSSKIEFWPILSSIKEFPECQPIVIGIYCGTTKPLCLNEYLRPFVDDLKSIVENGIQLNEQVNVQVRINCFVCDTPARSYIKGKQLILPKKNVP